MIDYLIVYPKWHNSLYKYFPTFRVLLVLLALSNVYSQKKSPHI